MSFARDIKTHLQQHTDLCLLVNVEGRIVASSPPTSNDKPPRESSCSELFNFHQSCPCESCYIRLAFQTGQTVTGELDHPEMGLIRIKVHPLSHPGGKKELATLHISPVPPKASTQPANWLKKQVLDGLPQAIFDTDPEGHISFANHRCLELLGYTDALPTSGVKLSHIIVPADRAEIQKIFNLTLLDKKCHSGEFHALTQSGDTLSAMVHFTALVESGHSVGVRGLLVNISRQKSAEDALAESEARCRQLAQYDQLTGLPNRTLLTEWLGNALKRCGKKSKPLAVMLLDLDRFKQVVDSLGDDCGDQVLCEVTRRLSQQLRRNDILARLNGDEFVLVYSNVTNLESLSLLAKRLLDSLLAPMQIRQHTVYQTASIGIVTSHGGDENPVSLLRQAAMAMNEVKQQGGNHCAYFSQEMQNQREANFLFEKHMREALERKEFYLHYQPQVDLASGRICGVEALVRWAGPSGNNPSPETFITVAEESGLIHPLGDYILREACAQNLGWQQAGCPPIQVTVNISAKQFNQADFVDKILQTLADTGLAPQWLELEITESAIMDNIHEALGTMQRLQNHGVQFAIDDFGTGHSSLNYLRKLSLSKLKIDRSFLLDVPGNRDNEKLIVSILALARSFDLQTVAEGIENENQLAYLQQLDCDLGQGYLFSRPVAPEAIPGLLSAKHS